MKYIIIFNGLIQHTQLLINLTIWILNIKSNELI